MIRHRVRTIDPTSDIARVTWWVRSKIITIDIRIVSTMVMVSGLL